MAQKYSGRSARGGREAPRRHAELFRILTRKRADLKRLIGEQMGYRLQGEDPATRGTPGDEGEAAAQALTTEVESEAMDRRVRMVKQVDLALRRLIEGAYGFCADCGQEIGVDRLRSLPFALRCRACQEVWEAAELRTTPRLALAGGTLPLDGSRTPAVAALEKVGAADLEGLV